MNKILVTGGAGFIGPNLTEEFLEKGHQVTVLEKYVTRNTENLQLLLDKFPTKLTLQVSDIRKQDDFHKAVKGIEYVFQEAALGSVLRSIKDPVTTNDVNVSGFLNMLVATCDSGMKLFIYKGDISIQ